MISRCRLPTVSHKADTVTFSAALGVLGECVGEIETQNKTIEYTTSMKIDRKQLVGYHYCGDGTTESRYENQTKIGDGTFGVAYRGEHSTSKVVRCVKKSNDETFFLAREIEIMKTLDHPNIVKIYETMQAEEDSYIVLQFCAGGDLGEHVWDADNRKTTLSEEYIARIMKQIVQAVAYLHRRNILHKDLKHDNIVLDKTKNYAKLIDFGLSEQLADSDGKSKVIGGSHRFMPPEAQATIDDNMCKSGLSLKADIWALGIIIYSSSSGYYPFPDGIPGANPLPTIPVTERYNSYSEELRDLVGKMLKHDPNERPSAEECLQHPFFKDVPDEEIDVVEEQTILDTLKTFSDKSQLYAALSNVVQHELNIDNSDSVVKLFKNIDTNGDGELSTEELYNYLNAHGWNTDDVDRLLRVADVDGNGYLEISEFVSACRSWDSENDIGVLSSAFETLDRGCQGSIGMDELAQVAILGEGFGSEDDIKKLLEVMGCGSEGRVDKQAFVHYMVKNN